MKKVLSALLSALVVSATVTALPLSANAASVEPGSQSVGAVQNDSVGYYSTVGDYQYQTFDNNGKTEIELLGYTGNESNINVVGYINGIPVTKIGAFTFGSSTITKINIPDVVTEIEDSAFSGCTNLKSIVLPSSLKKIGHGAFWRCSSLEEVVFPNSITEMDACMFWECTSLKRVTLPSSIKTVPIKTFFKCSALESVVMPTSPTKICMDAFYDCKALKSISLPKTLKTIDERAFEGCSSLQSITIPSGVTAIGDDAFCWDTSLKKVSLPSTLKTIGKNAFSLCYALESFTIPSGVTAIPEYMLGGDKALKKVTIPSTVTSIGKGAFNWCESLEGTITVPSGTTSIDSIFQGCKKLTGVVLPSTVKDLGESAFFACNSLKSVKIPEGVTEIPDETFWNCTDMTSVSLPSTVTSIGERAFYSCKKLESVKIPSKVKTIKDNTFEYCESLKTVTFNKGLTSLGEEAFHNCTSLNSISLPSTLLSIGKSAFYGCSNLETITGGSAVEQLGDYAFLSTNWDNNIPTGKAVYIGKIFYKYRPTDSERYGYNLAIKDGTKIIAHSSLWFESELNKIVIPASVTTIEENAFCDGSWSRLSDIYYLGTEDQWQNISIGDKNSSIFYATIHYNYGKSVSAPKLTGASNVNGGVKVAWNAVDGATKYKVFRKTADTDWKALKTVTTTTYTDKTAVSGTTYYYTVRCVSPIDNSVYISSYNTTGLKKTYYAAPVLKTPSNVNGGVKVSWDAVPGASKYKVLRRNADSSTWKAIGYTTSTSYTDKTAESGKTYYYSARCVKPEDNTSISGYEETGKKKTYYAATTLKKATNVNGGVTVTWEAVPGASKYKLIRRTADTDWKQIGYTTSTSYTDKTAVSGTTYYYSVRCVNPDNNTALSSIEEPGLKKTYIAAPVLSKIVNTSKGVQLTWKASVGAVNYKVYRKNSAGSWVGIGTTTGTTFYDKEAESGKIYTYTVKCVNADGTAPVSGFDNTGKTIKFIAAPVISSLTKTGNGITIKWNAPAGTSNHYKVFWKNENGNWQSIATTTTTSFTDHDVQSGTKYTYTIRVVSADENSNLSGYTSGKSITF